MIKDNISDRNLAKAYSDADAYWKFVENAFYSFGYTPEEKEMLLKISDCWWDVEIELVEEIKKRLEAENRSHGTNYITEGEGFHYIVKPFMEKNGYRDSFGWWIKKEV